MTTKNKAIKLLGEGFAAPLWGGHLGARDIGFSAEGVPAAENNGAGGEVEIVIMCDDPRWFERYPDAAPHDHAEEGDPAEGGLAGHGEEEDAPAPDEAEELDEAEAAIAQASLILAPCYAAAPTEMAACLEEFAGKTVGYTLFPSPNEKNAERPTIELARPMQATDETWDGAQAFIKAIGMQAEIVGDGPGLAFGRTIACMINEAALTLSDGVASAADIDRAMRYGVNYPKGLFAWADELGIDLVLDILQGLYDHYQEDRYRPAPLLRHLLMAGRCFHPGGADPSPAA